MPSLLIENDTIAFRTVFQPIHTMVAHNWHDEPVIPNPEEFIRGWVSTDVEKWLDEQDYVPGFYCTFCRKYPQVFIQTIEMTFPSERDLMLFKLRWC